MFNRVSTPEPARPADPVRPSGTMPLPPITKTPPPPFGLSTSSSAVTTASQSPAPVAMRAPDTPTSVLGPDITISGQQLVLKTKGSLLIAGQIQGDVHGESVTVGESGNVTGTIVARTIAVQGEVRGALKGSAVYLHATSKVDGDIVKQTLAIAEGAQFDGSVRRARDMSEVTPELT